MKKAYLPLIIALVITTFTKVTVAQDQVKLYEKPLTLTTYETGQPDLNPIFYTGRAYQGAKGEIYPYPMYNKLTDHKVEKPWHGVFLENKYIQLCVLPDIGGKLWYAKDKTDNYNFIYYNKQVKPALIGMLGAWTSGGLEWNIPHHHRASTFMPIDYTTEEHPDGSKTIWIGEIERRHRTKWMVGYTLYPDKAYFETTIKLYNRTPVEQSFLIFANTAVHANKNYQVFFPPVTQYGTYHSKNQFTEWPISHQVYSGVDYTRGVDVSMWKNHPTPVSIFDWGNGDFVAGYDHGKEAGTLVIGNPHIVTGRKFFEWGPGPNGDMWSKILTDSSGHYLELMTGAYSDNQPDYSWNNPYMVKTAKMTFAPLRNIAGVKKANKNAAVNLTVDDQQRATIGVNTTAEYHGARVILEANGNVIENESIEIAPDEPYVRELSLPAGISKYDLKLMVLSNQGKKLIEYQPVKQDKKPMPEPVHPPKSPKEMKTVEELYRAGLRLEQFYNPTLDPLAYYNEALLRDSSNSLVNTQMGIYYMKRGNYPVAEKYLRTAVATVTKDYTAPKDAESLYYLGLALLKQHKIDEAYDWLYKSTWDYAWQSPACYLLSSIDAQKGNYERALTEVNRSLETNTLNNKAWALKSALLRKLDKPEEARKVAENVLKNDPLSFLAFNERYLSEKALNTSESHRTLDHLTTLMRDEVENYLELATDYGRSGLYDDAIDVLNRAANSSSPKLNSYPMVYYYLGYYQEQEGKQQDALKNYKLAGNLPSDYCFPYRFESADVLKAALKTVPGDAKAHYYLGNLYYDNIPEIAHKEWQKSVQLDDRFAIAHRNLAFSNAHYLHNNDKAISEMEKATAENSDDPRYFAEMDDYYEQGGVSPQKRLNLLVKNENVVKQSDAALSHELRLLIFDGQYDKAIDVLKNHHFRKIEGVGNMHSLWVDAYVLRGKQWLARGKYDWALQDFNQALTYPDNLEVGSDNRGGEVQYYIAETYHKMGDKEKAHEHFKKVTDGRSWWSEQKYQQGMAYRELGESDKADEIFTGLIQYGRKRLSTDRSSNFFEKFSDDENSNARDANAHYLIGLGYLGQGNKSKAQDEFKKALFLNPAHLGAHVRLNGGSI